jgi:16S rRNA (guanine527-N7)-methyltransferase
VQSVDLRGHLQTVIGRSIDLPEAALDRLARYGKLLSHWNKRINLTSLELDPPSSDAVDRLFIEPLLAAPYIGSQAHWIDVGSGGGSPAIPLKIARPALKLTMIEARSRKAAFLREAARDLGLEDVSVLCDRVEAVAAHSSLANSAELITIRAVRFDSPVIDACRSLLLASGELFVFGSPTPATTPPGFRLRQSVSLITTTLTIFQRMEPRCS